VDSRKVVIGVWVTAASVACNGLLGIEPLDASLELNPRESGLDTNDASDAGTATEGHNDADTDASGDSRDMANDSSIQPDATPSLSLESSTGDADGPLKAGLRDLNNDGFVDLLWHNADTGESHAWFMNDTVVEGSNSIKEQSTQQVLQVVSPWNPVGLADINLDGHIDLLWQDSQTGEVVAWFLTGTDRIGSNWLHELSSGALLSTASPWFLEATGDFNHDGSVDLVFHRSDTGETQVWFMSGTDRISSTLVFDVPSGDASVGPIPADASEAIPEPVAEWTLVSAADFNQDGWPDLLWHSVSGGTYVWFMSGSNRTGSSPLTNSANGQVLSVDTHWTVAGTGDFNRDGSPDLIWYNASTGVTEIWYMSGTRLIGTSDVTTNLDADVLQPGIIATTPWTPVAE
jgi:hypothetical protein